jgi:hypothetical protein
MKKPNKTLVPIEILKKEKEAKPTNLSNEKLLILLGKRIAAGVIKRELSCFGNYLIYESKKGMVKVDLYDGRITPDRAFKELLKKYG